MCFGSSSPPAKRCQTSWMDGSLQGHPPFGGTSLHGVIQPCYPYPPTRICTRVSGVVLLPVREKGIRGTFLAHCKDELIKLFLAY